MPLPAWFMNHVAKKVAPKAIKSMCDAVLGYNEYKQRQDGDLDPYGIVNKLRAKRP